MDDHRDTPPITIVDPSRPATLADVLGDEDRDPWRPRPWQVVLVVVLVLAAAALAAARTLDRQAQQRRLQVTDRRVQLSLVPPVGPVAGVQDTVTVALLNTGARTVQVDSVQVLAPGYAVQQVTSDVSASSTGVDPRNLALAVTPTCSDQVLTGSPSRLLVRVRTPRGEHVQVTLALPGPVRRQIMQVGQDRCGLLALGDSVSGSVVEAGPLLPGVLVLQIYDRSVLPVTVLSVDAGPSLTATTRPRLPLALVPRAADSSRNLTVQDLELQVRITDCAALQPRLGMPAKDTQIEVAVSVARGTDHATTYVTTLLDDLPALRARVLSCR